MYSLLILVLLFVLTLNESSEILIQKYDKNFGLGLGLGIDNKVIFPSVIIQCVALQRERRFVSVLRPALTACC